MLDQFRDAEPDEAEERAQGGQALVARGDAVATRFFEVAQEGAHQLGIDLLDRDAGRVGAMSCGDEAEQQQQAVAIAVAGMGAEVAVRVELLEQETADERTDQVGGWQGVSPFVPGSA